MRGSPLLLLFPPVKRAKPLVACPCHVGRWPRRCRRCHRRQCLWRACHVSSCSWACALMNRVSVLCHVRYYAMCEQLVAQMRVLMMGMPVSCVAALWHGVTLEWVACGVRSSHPIAHRSPWNGNFGRQAVKESCRIGESGYTTSAALQPTRRALNTRWTEGWIA